jgi:hypothetical protein
MALGTSTGGEHADVHAEFAYLFALIGSRAEAEDMLIRAEAQRRRGLTDLQAESMSVLARALLDLNADPQRSLASLDGLTRDRPMDVGDSLRWDGVMALCELMLGDADAAYRRASILLIRETRYTPVLRSSAEAGGRDGKQGSHSCCGR